MNWAVDHRMGYLASELGLWWVNPSLFTIFYLVLQPPPLFVHEIVALTWSPDKKNENKSVAVNEFLPAADAIAAIKYSM